MHLQFLLARRGNASPQMMRRVILALCLTAGANLDAAATSCMPLEHRYFVVCDGQSCRTAFSVLEVAGFSKCSRRPVIANPDTQVDAFLGLLVKEVRKSEARGIFEIKFDGGYWDAATPDTPASFFKLLKGSVQIDEKLKCSDIRVMPLGELIPQLNEQRGESWLVQRAEGTSVKEIAALRAGFETKALQQKIIGIAGVSVNWLSSRAALLFRPLRHQPAKTPRCLADPRGDSTRGRRSRCRRGAGLSLRCLARHAAGSRCACDLAGRGLGQVPPASSSSSSSGTSR